MNDKNFLKIVGTISWGLFIWSVIEWSEKNPKMWAITLVPLFVFGTIYFEYYKTITFPKSENNFIHYIDDSKKCLCNGYYLAFACRIISVIFAIIQLFVIRESNEWETIIKHVNTTVNVTIDLPSDFQQYYIFAAIASMLYVLSGIVLCISLCQCAVIFEPSEKLTILSWGLHDLILGFIWEALSLQFHDVIDDNDDSHWRALFSSMIVFHILTMLFNIWNNNKYNIKWFQTKRFRICSDETESSIFMLFRFLLYCVIYYWILRRLHTNDKLLISMGLNDWRLESIIASISIIIIINILDNEEVGRMSTVVDNKKNRMKAKSATYLNF